MDKDKLFYVVVKGTNTREFNFDGNNNYRTPFIADELQAKETAEHNSNRLQKEWVAISIQEFEAKFCEEPEAKE